MKTTLRLAAVVALVLIWTLGSAAAQSNDTSGFEPLTECLQESDSLSVLFLLDASKSLEKTDPDDARVDALNVAMTSLELLTQVDERNRKLVTVDFVAFGTLTQRAFPLVERWANIESVDWSPLVASIAERNTGYVTDYGAALTPWAESSTQQEGALSLLESAPGACRVLLWFSDGELDIWEPGRERTIEVDGNITEFETQVDEDRASPTVRAALCKRGGLVDDMRGTGDGLLSGRIFVVGVGLSDPTAPVDFSLFQAIVEGFAAGEVCGDQDRAALGMFIETDLSDLEEAIWEAVNPNSSPVCELPDDECAFELGPGLTSFNLLVRPGGEFVGVKLIAPTGLAISLNDATDTETDNIGVELVVEEISPTAILVKGDLKPGNQGWHGTWHVEFEGDGDRDNAVFIHVFGDLDAEIVGSGDLRRGFEGRFELQLVNAAGTPPLSPAWNDVSDIEVIFDGRALVVPEISASNVFAFDVSLPRDYAEEAIVQVIMRPRLVIVDGVPPVELREFDASFTLEVAPPAVAAVVLAPDASLFTPLDKDNLRSSSALQVRSVGQEDGSCVQFVGASVSALPSAGFEAPDIRVAGSLPSTERCIAEVRGDQTISLPVELEVASSDISSLNADGGEIEFELEFKTFLLEDPATGEDFNFGGNSVAAIPTIVTGTDWSKVQWVAILSLLVPLFLLYLANYVVGARVRPLGAGHYADLEVEVDASGVRRLDGRPELVVDDELMPAGGLSREGKRLSLVGAEGPVALFSSRASWSPFGSPYVVGQFATARGGLLAGPLGSTRDGAWARLPSPLQNLWVLEATVADPPAPTLTELDRLEIVHGSKPMQVQGRLLILLGTDVHDSSELLSEIRAEIVQAVMAGNSVFSKADAADQKTIDDDSTPEQPFVLNLVEPDTAFGADQISVDEIPD